MATQTQSMTISTGKSKTAPSVEVQIKVPANDAEWLKFYGINRAERDRKALRQVRVDIANGGARDHMRGLVKRGVEGEALVKEMQTWVNGWRNGQKTIQVPVLDLRGMESVLGAEQIAALVKDNPGHKVLLTEKQQTALDALEENESSDDS